MHFLTLCCISFALQTTTKVYPHILVKEKEGVPLWVIIVAVLAGLLLLILIIVLLYKVRNQLSIANPERSTVCKFKNMLSVAKISFYFVTLCSYFIPS